MRALRVSFMSSKLGGVRNLGSVRSSVRQKSHRTFVALNYRNFIKIPIFRLDPVRFSSVRRAKKYMCSLVVVQHRFLVLSFTSLNYLFYSHSFNSSKIFITPSLSNNNATIISHKLLSLFISLKSLTPRRDRGLISIRCNTFSLPDPAKLAT